MGLPGLSECYGEMPAELVQLGMYHSDSSLLSLISTFQPASSDVSLYCVSKLQRRRVRQGFSIFEYYVLPLSDPTIVK